MLNLNHPFAHVSIEDVKKEIKALDEQCKGNYSFANSEDDYSLLVDVKNLLDNMQANEIDPTETVEIDGEEIPFQTWLYEYSDMEELKADNSYNWCSPLSHGELAEVYGGSADYGWSRFGFFGVGVGRRFFGFGRHGLQRADCRPAEHRQRTCELPTDPSGQER